MDISNLIKSLKLGICPAELLYKPNLEVTEFDWERVLYNIRYHDPTFYDNKFPPEIKQIPAYDKIINLIVEKNKDNSPLKEIIERKNETALSGFISDNNNGGFIHHSDYNNVDKDYTDEEVVFSKQEDSICSRIYSEGDC